MCYTWCVAGATTWILYQIQGASKGRLVFAFQARGKLTASGRQPIETFSTQVTVPSRERSGCEGSGGGWGPAKEGPRLASTAWSRPFLFLKSSKWPTTAFMSEAFSLTRKNSFPVCPPIDGPAWNIGSLVGRVLNKLSRNNVKPSLTTQAAWLGLG
jgi:hypothetical protein